MQYVEFKKVNGDLEITLTDEGRAEFDDILAEQEKHGSMQALCELLEYQLCNGWDWVRPEEIGALTNAPILSEEVDRDDQGDLKSVGRVYWFPDYMVTDEIEELQKTGKIVFKGVE
jgi:hypothetical protein